MNPRKLIYSGTAIIVASIFVPILIEMWAIYNAFQALQTNQTAGIGAIGGNIGTAMFAAFFGLIGILIGVILIIVGKKQSQSPI